jgi:hypothetical protein
MSEAHRLKHVLPDFFEPEPLSLLQFLADRISPHDWNIFVDRTQCDTRTRTELLAVIRPRMTAFPELSVDAYDAVCSVQHHYDHGYTPERTSKDVLEAFGTALAIASEVRGVVVDEAADNRLARLIELSHAIDLACLRLCGGFVSWIRIHIQGHVWATSGMVAEVAILALAIAQLSAAAHLESAERPCELMTTKPAALQWKALLSRGASGVNGSLDKLIQSLERSASTP